MFQRLKGFNLDTFLEGKIAEEEARQKKQAPGATGSRRTPNSNAVPTTRRTGSRTDSPSSLVRSSTRTGGHDATASLVGKTPDPEEFVIGDDSTEPSRTGTPKPTKETSTESSNGDDAEKPLPDPTTDKGKSRIDANDLPEDVRKRLAKMETLTTRYQDLLRNYRTAHARVSAIEPFEAALREATPLTSIADPIALTEYLNQRNLQSGMVLEELKRVTGEHKDVVKERDELKGKLEHAEKRVGEGAASPVESETHIKGTGFASKGEKEAVVSTNPQDDEFFSFETEQKRSLEEQVTQLQVEREKSGRRIDELVAANAVQQRDLANCEDKLTSLQRELEAKETAIVALEHDLSIAKQSNEEPSALAAELSDVRKTLSDTQRAQESAQEEAERKERKMETIRLENDVQISALQIRLDQSQQSLTEANRLLKEQTVAAEETLRQHQEAHQQNVKDAKYAQRDDKGMESLRNLVKTLRDQAGKAEDVKTQAEGRINDLQFEIKRLEAEVASSSGIIAGLRHHEAAVERLKKKTTEAERERDEAKKVAETKKGHEAAVASLRSQLKRAENDRDRAYQMILDCGKCTAPENDVEAPPEAAPNVDSQATEVQVPEGETPNGGDVSTDTKKKSKKKKSKAKKKASAVDTSTPVEEPGTEVQLREPTRQDIVDIQQSANEMMKHGMKGENVMNFIQEYITKVKTDQELQDDERDAVRRHLEESILERDETLKDKMRTIEEREEEISTLRQQIGEKEATIIQLTQKIKGEEDLRYELENTQESLLDLGTQITDAKDAAKTARERSTHLEEECEDLQKDNDKLRKSFSDYRAETAKEQQTLKDEINTLQRSRENSGTAQTASLEKLQKELESVQAEKSTLQVAKDAAERQLDEIKTENSSTSTKAREKHESLVQELAQVKKKAEGLERDLAATNLLAQNRFKDLTDLREHIAKLQPELKQLRQDAVALKSVQVDLENSSAAVRKLESKEKELRAEIADHKSRLNKRETEFAVLKEKCKQSEQRCAALEESHESSRQELEKSQKARDEAIEERGKVESEVKKAEQENKSIKAGRADLERQLSKFSEEASGLREELHLKSAQQASSQSLMESLRDQTQELATQMKEIRERNESLEEELADAHRLLSERSREGDTMRRMLSEVEHRTEVRVKEIRERMELAIEERDRAEDESSSIGRRKARELDDLKARLREAEQNAARAVEAREAAERHEREFHAQRIELEQRAKQGREELDEGRDAMAQLRDALDESERQSRELEKQRVELRQVVEEREARLERMSKSSKAMAEELRGLKMVQSSRSSLDSSRVTSPGPARTINNNIPATPTGAAGKETDYVYLKNVLLQFLEQKDKKHQLQLVPVLGMLLHFDKQDEQKLTSAISTR